MASSAFSAQHHIVATRKGLIGGTGFNNAMGILVFLFMGGLYLDGWAHGHGRVDNTFFTPWHAVLYSGYLFTAALLVISIVINHSRGYSWRQAIPRGYELALLGVPLFMIAGVGDLIWHTLFGFEVSLEQLLSPTHLLLATSGVLIMSGPFRAAWQRTGNTTGSWRTLLPMIFSLAAVLMVFTFFTEFAHPFSNTWTVTDDHGFKSFGAAGILLHTAILMGFILLAQRRWQLPLGSLTFIFTSYVVLLSVLDDGYRMIPAIVVVGIIADLLNWRLKPSAVHAVALRLFAFLVPMLLYLAYFLTLLVAGDTIAWSIHLWLGSSFMAGVVGLVLSLLVVPPQIPAQEASEDVV